ncbi:MAG: type II 3-dehydroquinate dehydratase [Candidatus Neomarinimicrobiota bacterium]
MINGPNLNLLGTREPELYGRETLAEMMVWLAATPEAAGHELSFFQSNHEGAIIDCIQEARGQFAGILINPAAFTHYSYAIRDAIAAVAVPTVEVHLSAIAEREPFRRISVISDVCLAQVAGLGRDSYRVGLARLLAAIPVP